MPLTSAIQSAMAVRHERRKREERRLSKIRRESDRNERRESSSVTGGGADGAEITYVPAIDHSNPSMTTFHMGVVFILLGFIIIFSSMIPSSLIKRDWSHLLGVGLSFIFIGLIMVMLNRIITSKEDKELSRYIRQRLARSKSGNILIRDPETGYVTPAPTSSSASAATNNSSAATPIVKKRSASVATDTIAHRASLSSANNEPVANGNSGGVGEKNRPPPIRTRLTSLQEGSDNTATADNNSTPPIVITPILKGAPGSVGVGGGSGAPKSPRDKVSFAEFTMEINCDHREQAGEDKNMH